MSIDERNKAESKNEIPGGLSPEEIQIIRLQEETIEANKKAGKKIKELILEVVGTKSLKWPEWPTIPVIDRRDSLLIQATREAIEISPGSYRKLHIQGMPKELIQTSDKIVFVKGEGIFRIPWRECPKDPVLEISKTDGWNFKYYDELPDWENRGEIEMAEYVIFGNAAISAIRQTTARFARLARRT